MYISGIADEAGQPLETQIKAHHELGLKHIEVRMVDNQSFTQMDDAAFTAVFDRLSAAGLQISCYGSSIANWSRPITDDFKADVEELERCVPRMQKTKTQFIRVMSWPNQGLNQEDWGNEAVRRMQILAQMAEAGGVTLGLENCTGYASQNAAKMLEFIERVNSPALKIIFDTGNSVGYNLNSLDMYTQLKPHIAYVHIKDGYRDSEGRIHYVQPNCGMGYVRQILSDLQANGYEGGLSLEPHVMAVVHTGKTNDDAAALYQSYIEYGENFKTLLAAVRESSPVLAAV